MEGKRGKGKPRIMFLDDINDNQTYEKITRRAMGRDCLRKSLSKTHNMMMMRSIKAW